jgi:CheY-like chemotaxis protein
MAMTHVLVIDDDRSVCSAIEALLLNQDCSVVLADSGEIAKSFKNSHFDVIMVDIVMPGMDGFETMKVFRKRTPAVPIIAMSGFRFSDSAAAAPNFLLMASKLGASYCLRKPFTPLQLMTAINSCLEEMPKAAHA